MKKSDVLDLIKYHYEGRETEFRNQSIAIARNFNKHGDKIGRASCRERV